MLPSRIQRKRCAGWQAPQHTVMVTRPSIWGNPFAIGKHVANAGEAVEAYKEWFPTAKIRTGARLKDFLPFLFDMNLGCFCSIGKPCHADFLLESAYTERAKIAGGGPFHVRVPTNGRVLRIMGLDDVRFDGRYRILDGYLVTDAHTASQMAEEAVERASGIGGWDESKFYSSADQRALRSFATRLGRTIPSQIATTGRIVP